MKRTHGYRAKSRGLLSKKIREKGIGGLSKLMIEYNIGELVHINVSSTSILTAPHRRYQGRVGRIIGKRGRAYLVEVKVGRKKKIIITTKEHLKSFRKIN